MNKTNKMPFNVARKQIEDGQTNKKIVFNRYFRVMELKECKVILNTILTMKRFFRHKIKI